MKKISFLILLLVGCMAHTYTQVGINTTSPLASLHVEAEKTDNTTPEGIIAPKLTREQLIAKTNNNQYTTAHAGTFVYVTALDGTPSTPTTSNVTTIGYYYFDGSIWKHFNDKLQNANNGLSLGTTANVQLGGDLEQNTTIDAKAFNLSVLGTGTTRVQPHTTIGSDITPPTAAILNLQTQPDATGNGGVNANGGLILPRVQLTDNNSLKPFIISGGSATEKDSHKGMIVYHIGGNGFDSGIYVWNGDTWMKYIDKLPPATGINIRNLQTPCISSPNKANNTHLGEPMDFEQLKIPEDGSYAFTFRLYGSLAVKPPVGDMIIYYIALLANGTLKDTAEMDIIPGANMTVITYSITLGAEFKAGDIVTFRLSHYPNTPFPWTLNVGTINTAARTSMIWWKL